MLKLKFLVVANLCFAVLSCAANRETAAKFAYVWQEITSRAEFPPGYNYPVFVLDNGKMLALNAGGWLSSDGRNWTKTNLPESGLKTPYQKYVRFRGAVYALGAMRGDYLGFTISTKIRRTRDGENWETVTEKSNLPRRIFFGATVFQDKIWLVGGYDGAKYHNDVWNSADGANWTQVTSNARWSPRNTHLIVFKNKLLLMGGGAIDGGREINPNAKNEYWISDDGANWTPTETNPQKKPGGTPVVFDDKLWLVGANRDNGFSSGVFFSADGLNWQEMRAPWSPRGGTVVWISGGKLFMTGGKYSYAENGAIKFVYSNDVWTMSRQRDS